MAGLPSPQILAALRGGAPGPAPTGAPLPPPPPGAMPPGAPPPHPPMAGGPAGAQGGMPAQIMMLAFLAGAGLDKIVGSIQKLRDAGTGSRADRQHRGGVRVEAAQNPGMTIAPQMAQMMAQNPGLAARLMSMVRGQMGGPAGPPQMPPM